MWHDYYSVTSIDETLQILAERGERVRIVAGGTDLILELERGVRKGIDTLVDITRVPCLEEVVMDECFCKLEKALSIREGGSSQRAYRDTPLQRR